MGGAFASFFSLLLSTAILLVGNGLLGTLIPVSGDTLGFSQTALGALGSSYFAGFMGGCFVAANIVRRAGHIRAFAVFAAVATTMPLIHATLEYFWVWVVARLVVGFCFAGLYMVIESWLNERATNESRGGLFATYLIVNLSAITCGQLLLNLASPSGFALFALVAILTSLAVVPVSLTRSVQPAPIQSTSLQLRNLMRISPVGLIGCFAVGLSNGPFWTLGPVFAREAGLDLQGISFFMTAAILGGAVGQWPIGRLSDRIDRRIVIVGVSLAAVAGSAALALLEGFGSLPLLLCSAFLFGGCAFTLYSLCVAHTNDHADPAAFVSVSGSLLLANSAGSTVGPLVAALGTPYLGISSIFYFGALVFLGLAGFVLIRIRLRAPIPAEDRSDFVPMPVERASPDAIELDPRSTVEEQEPEAPDAAELVAEQR